MMKCSSKVEHKNLCFVKYGGLLAVEVTQMRVFRVMLHLSLSQFLDKSIVSLILCYPILALKYHL